MTIYSLSPDDAAVPRPVQERPDTTSAYDSTWTEQPESQPPEGLDRIMGVDGKIYVVLAVVLIIWFGLVALLVRTDRKIGRLERELADDGSPKGMSPKGDA
jgi:CcmD family protein